MKKFLLGLALIAGIGGLAACSNGDYKASPTANGNDAINPITPLTSSEFTWTGEVPLSADINGTHWKADAATFYLDTSGANVITASKGNVQMYLYLRDVWTGNLYDMSFHNYSRFAMYADSVALHTGGAYYSHLGNSGEVKITSNDSNYIVGQFYYKGVNAAGQDISVKNGYFKIYKH